MRSLEGLVDAGDLDGLLSRVTLDEIADAWWRHNLRDFDDDTDAALADPDWWAVEAWLDHLFDKDEALAARALRALAERVPPEADLGLLGAGPVEEFVTDEARLCWIESEAARSPNLRAALANVYPKPSLSDEQNARLRRAAETG